jgi:hypothetical protein
MCAAGSLFAEHGEESFFVFDVISSENYSSFERLIFFFEFLCVQ